MFCFFWIRLWIPEGKHAGVKLGSNREGEKGFALGWKGGKGFGSGGKSGLRLRETNPGGFTTLE